MENTAQEVSIQLNFHLQHKDGSGLAPETWGLNDVISGVYKRRLTVVSLHYHVPDLCLGTVLKQQLKRINQWHISALLSPADRQFHELQYTVTLSACPLENWVRINPLKPELNPICYLLALLGAYHFLHVSRIRVKLLNLGY